MINKEEVHNLFKEYIDDKKFFIVDYSISSSNLIKLSVDGFDGVTIQDCVNISRLIEHNLDREKEDFELQVSSAGLSEAIKVQEQYFKNEGREMDIVLLSGEKVTGTMSNVNAESITLTYSKKEKVEGKKKKQLIEYTKEYRYDEISSARVNISF
ncbi:ribosome assembly cofactor RimP [Bacteroidales bacterium]|nr:ribosome assembly cofactor RimP [Bacteroidales bacterium]